MTAYGQLPDIGELVLREAEVTRWDIARRGIDAAGNRLIAKITSLAFGAGPHADSPEIRACLAASLATFETFFEDPTADGCPG